MEFIATVLDGAYIINLDPKVDKRGSFTRMFCKQELSQINFNENIVQINHSITNEKGTIRGMHYQNGSSSEIKIIRVIKGSVYDVIVDMRPNSKTYLKWISNILSKDSPQLLYVPQGFAHGFQTLSQDVEMIYQHSSFFDPTSEMGFLYNDPKIGISWPLPVSVVSERDLHHPTI
ncbi:MAG: dTDP-4-dehydrorhamnose 3,5-epimerase family protein [Gillisia sp.]